MAESTPISDEVVALHEARIEAEPEFEYIREDTERLQKQITKNSISLNEAVRTAEVEENKARRESREAARKKRNELIAKHEALGAAPFVNDLEACDRFDIIDRLGEIASTTADLVKTAFHPDHPRKGLEIPSPIAWSPQSQMVRIDDLALGQDRRALDAVFELTDIAWPGVPPHHIHRGR